MSQATLVLDGDSDAGPDLIGDLHAFRAALFSDHEGPTEPAYKVRGITWMDTSADPVLLRKRYDGAQWVTEFMLDTTAHTISYGGAAAAGDISFTPAGSIAATDVQAAIAELDAEKQPLDADLTALAGQSGTGLYERTGAGTGTTRPVGVSDPTDILSRAGGDGRYAAIAADPRGKQTIWVPAGAMVPRTTSGAAPGLVESSSNKVMSSTLDFDAAADEFAQFMAAMPKGWNEGTVTAEFIWQCGVTGNVVWGLQAVAISNDDVTDGAFGTAVTVTDGVTATTDVMVSAESGAVTIGGTPAELDLVVFQVYRDADNGSDTAAGDARLLGLRLYYTAAAATDA